MHERSSELEISTHIIQNIDKTKMTEKYHSLQEEGNNRQRKEPFPCANGKISKLMDNHDTYPQAINTGK